ncbi:hypothetical protein KB206_00340 [Microvirga sp. STS02]|uniref:hypothetical protein n=1 Tax=Hymenobacter negativus TaxID=2795026 RepID=UPI0018DCDF39|nr:MULTISPECIES: hypothetical protein [Bacteria]MBH8567313.1 hypothetical protein [Hymenobacter negativus]MBR7207045.1 hypothetical protein [Microvirga sp. STS02]
MRPSVLRATTGLLFLLTACQQEPPLPAPAKQPLVEVRLTQVGKTPYASEAMVGYDFVKWVPSASGSTPVLGKPYPKLVFHEGSQRVTLGYQWVGPHPCLMIYYRKGGEAGAVAPAPGEYIEGELFVDGRSQGTVRVDAGTVNLPYPCNRFTDGPDTNVYGYVQAP